MRGNIIGISVDNFFVDVDGFIGTAEFFQGKRAVTQDQRIFRICLQKRVVFLEGLFIFFLFKMPDEIALEKSFGRNLRGKNITTY